MCDESLSIWNIRIKNFSETLFSPCFMTQLLISRQVAACSCQNGLFSLDFSAVRTERPFGMSLRLIINGQNIHKRTKHSALNANTQTSKVLDCALISISPQISQLVLTSNSGSLSKTGSLSLLTVPFHGKNFVPLSNSEFVHTEKSQGGEIAKDEGLWEDAPRHSSSGHKTRVSMTRHTSDRC